MFTTVTTLWDLVTFLAKLNKLYVLRFLQISHVTSLDNFLGNYFISKSNIIPLSHLQIINLILNYRFGACNLFLYFMFFISTSSTLLESNIDSTATQSGHCIKTEGRFLGLISKQRRWSSAAMKIKDLLEKSSEGMLGH